MKPRCARCNAFLARVIARVRSFGGEPEEILSVKGTCWRHGRVEAAGDSWCWETFYPEPA